MRSWRSPSLPAPKSCVRPCTPLMLTDSVGASAPAPLRGSPDKSFAPGVCPEPAARPELPAPSAVLLESIDRLWKPRPAIAAAALRSLVSTWRDARINSRSAFPDGFSGFSTTSRVCIANPMNSARNTYRPRGSPAKIKVPSEIVATVYFFPVKVLEAVSVTPGNGVFPL